LAGFTPVEIKTGTDGTLNAEDVRKYVSKDVAGIMITNPNTFGIFEKDIKKISGIMHENGSLVYMDGANFNAFIGNIKISDMGIDMVQFNLHKTFSAPHGGGGPGSGAIGVIDLLKEYLPVPYVSFSNARYKISEDKERTIGRIAPFLCNFAVVVRAYAYLLSVGKDNISSVSEIAILNANYIKKKLGKILEGSDPFEKGLCMHECVFNDTALEKNGISTVEFAKLLIDYGFHPPTVYFPKNIRGAIMIEPTETESIKTLDGFIKAVEAIRFKIKKLKAVKSPQKTKVGRVNEVLANKHPIFK
jgi:glycine dehydrogenase subunit 2